MTGSRTAAFLGLLCTALVASCGGAATGFPTRPSPTVPAGSSGGPGAPLGLTASGAPQPKLSATSAGAARTPVRLSGTTDAALVHDERAQIDIVYNAFMSDLSGLLDYLSKDWLTAISEIATQHMTNAAAGAAGAVQQAHDHGIGTLVDSHRVISLAENKASLTDCLDELHWYVVEDKTGKPDPSVTPGYFRGSATFMKVEGQWKVSSWNSHPERCAF